MGAQRAPAGERTKVIYVIGAGHSGSTILGLTLGNCDGVFFAGEVARWLRYDGRPPLAGEERAELWRRVREQVDVPPELLRLGSRPLEQSTAIFRPGTWREQWRRGGRYQRVTQELFEAISRVTGATHVVDSSHFPRRARHLQKLEGIELHLLFLVRNPQSVVASYGRENVPHKQTWKMPTANAYLWLTNMLSLLVFLRQPRTRRLFIRHEAFIANPAGVIRQILDGVGSSAEVPDLTALRTGLAFQGNRLLRGDVVALKADPERPPKGSRITALLHLPWRAVFSLLRPVAEPAPQGPAQSQPTGRTAERA
jgi:hypothetical protein